MKSSTRPVKVVFDTNIIVSALMSKHGFPARLFEALITGKVENYTSSEIIEEIESVFGREEVFERAGKKAVGFVLKHYKKYSKVVTPKEKLFFVKDDPKDNKFIECAAEAKADYIISGDPHLTKLSKHGKTRILKTSESSVIFRHKKSENRKGTGN